jgi:hypothetical protein
MRASRVTPPTAPGPTRARGWGRRGPQAAGSRRTRPPPACSGMHESRAGTGRSLPRRRGSGGRCRTTPAARSTGPGASRRSGSARPTLRGPCSRSGWRLPQRTARVDVHHVQGGQDQPGRSTAVRGRGAGRGSIAAVDGRDALTPVRWCNDEGGRRSSVGSRNRPAVTRRTRVSDLGAPRGRRRDRADQEWT